ncbi:MAG TPA: DNA-3-methyladenine glycosylase I [Pseudomonadales bacterium]
MDSFDSIFQRAAERKGGPAALEDMLPVPASDAVLRKRPDDRYLAEMTKCIFRSGFVWQIIENKWSGFEAAFDRFDVSSAAMLSDEDLERLGADERIVRNGVKIRAVRGNAQFIREVREEHGSFGAFLAAWPREDFVGMWEVLKQRGERLGGQTGRFFLRFVGWDTPVLSADVVGALIAQGVVDRNPTSRKALLAVQAAFNAWHEESGRPFCQISRTLSATV